MSATAIDIVFGLFALGLVIMAACLFVAILGAFKGMNDAICLSDANHNINYYDSVSLGLTCDIKDDTNNPHETVYGC